VRQRGDLEVLLGQHRILPCQLGLLLFKQCPNLRQHGGVDVGAGEFVEQIHG
jgi:hypothetical protein